jgi:hypothetical protein
MDEEVLKIAKRCRHYAMCKIDFLGSGVCASGVEKSYVSYYPQGRMILYAALAEGKIPITGKCIDIAATCDLCGKCDKQCYFATEMRPTQVMKALKEHIAGYLATGGIIEKESADPLLARIHEIVGAGWATDDRGIAVTYSHDPSALAVTKMPRYVVLPESRSEISALLKLFKDEDIPWVVRGNGTSVMGFHLGSGAIIDLNRMKTIEFDDKNWSVQIGPGVTAFDLQREAIKRGYRVNVAEPAALVCGSTMCSGILSLFSTAYGTSADNYIDAEFVDREGELFTLNQKNAPNLFAFHLSDHTSPGICTSLKTKLQPTTVDETGVLVPFQSLQEAIDFAAECAKRRIGLAIGILGAEYVSAFIAPSQKLAEEARNIFEERLGISHMVMVLGDKYTMGSIREMGYPLIDQQLFSTLCLALPSLKSATWLHLVSKVSEDDPFSYLKVEGFGNLAKAALAPSPDLLVQDVDPELRAFYRELYARPEITNLVWLNTFRITSTRIGREKHFFPLLMYLPLEFPLISEMCEGLKLIAESHNLKNEFGFITPVDSGKRCIFEYDYYHDITDQDERLRMQKAAAAAGALIEELTARTGTIRWLRYILYQGYCRKENLLYA